MKKVANCYSSRSQISFGNAISLEILFPFSHRLSRCIPALDHGCKVELRDTQSYSFRIPKS